MHLYQKVTAIFVATSTQCSTLKITAMSHEDSLIHAVISFIVIAALFLLAAHVEYLSNF